MEETAVTADDLLLAVTGKTIKGRRGVYDGGIVSSNVCNSKRAREINWAEIDYWIWAIRNASQDRKEVET